MSEEREPIRGNVARILNERELVINVGASKGVKAGMMFKVLDPKGEDIVDPISRKSLGSLNLTKIEIRVVDVRSEMAIASTKSHRVNIGGTGKGIGSSIEASIHGILEGMSTFSQALLPPEWLAEEQLPPKWVEKYETLRAREEQKKDLDEKNSYVKVGDPVVQILEKVDTSPPEEP